jgi:hypothetical protein
MSLSQQIDALEKKLNREVRNRRALESKIRHGGTMSRQTWSELISWTTADGTAVHTTTDETILFPNLVLPANYMQDGRMLTIVASGKLSTTATPTMTWAVRWGGVTGTLIATSEAITMGSGVATVNWRIHGELITRSNGATGALLFMGELHVHTAAGTVLTNIFSVSGYDAPAQVTSDLTADTALSLTGDWSASSASNTITGMMYAIRSEN